MIRANDPTSAPRVPVFLTLALERTAVKMKAQMMDANTVGIPGMFRMNVGTYTRDDGTPVVEINRLHIEEDYRRQGLGKKLLLTFFNNLSYTISRRVDLVLYSVNSAFGFYLSIGMLIELDQGDERTIYESRKAKAFGDDWHKYMAEINDRLPDAVYGIDDIYPLFKASPIYNEVDTKMIFSYWVSDVLGRRIHGMFKEIKPALKLSLIRNT